MRTKEQRKEYLKEYYQRPEVKRRNRESMRKYRQIPEFKLRERKYYQKNKEQKKEYQRKNKERIKEKKRLNYLKNKEKIREENKKWREDNKEKRREYMKKYYQNNKDKLKKYIKKNKEKINKWGREYIKNKKKTDKNYKIRCNLRKSVWTALRNFTKTGKVKPSKKYGIDWKKVINHLKPFPEDLSKYHIDHIKPLCSFDLTNPEEIKKAFAPENHQWLTIQDNLIKGGRY